MLVSLGRILIEAVQALEQWVLKALLLQSINCVASRFLMTLLVGGVDL